MTWMLLTEPVRFIIIIIVGGTGSGCIDIPMCLYHIGRMRWWIRSTDGIRHGTWSGRDTVTATWSFRHRLMDDPFFGCIIGMVDT